ncbi:Undecaprenyl-phosphate mannosyltransferase [subsurface metagenome]
MKLSIIIPAYNEENRIKPTLESYVNYFSARYELELIVVLNGCIDGTKDLIEDFAKGHHEVKSLDFPQRLGKGGALIEGFKIADGDIVGFVDADRSVQAEEFDKLITALNSFDGAIASRWLPDSKTIIKETKTRKFARWGFKLLIRTLFGLTFKDTQCGAKVFKGRVMKDIVPQVSIIDSSFDIDLLYRATTRGYKIQEVPITWLYSMDTRLKLRSVIFPIFFSLMRLKIKTLPLRRFSV